MLVIFSSFPDCWNVTAISLQLWAVAQNTILRHQNDGKSLQGPFWALCSKRKYWWVPALENHNSLRSYLREIIYSEKNEILWRLCKSLLPCKGFRFFSGTWNCLLQPLRCFSAYENLWPGMANWLVFVSGWLVFGRVSLFHAAKLQVESSYWSKTICGSW